jgi:hypothetical protein
MPLRRLSASSVQLSVGAGPLHLGMASGTAPTIDHYCLGVDAFDADRIVKVLAEHGVAKSDTRGPM